MSNIDARAVELLEQFRAEVDSMRHRAAEPCWQALSAALEPTLVALGAEPSSTADVPTWATAVQTLDSSLASDISEAVKVLSLALKDHYRTVTPRDQRVSNAIAFLYMDVARPLWSAHPSLEPVELRSS